MVLVPSPKPEPEPSVADSDTTPDHGETTIGPGDSPRKAVAPTGPDAQSELSRPQFAGDDAQLTEIEREQVVARKVALRKIPARGVHLGLLMDFVVSGATGTAERDAVPMLLDDGRQRGLRPRTLEGDRGYDTRQCVKDMGGLGVTPQCAQMA